MSRRRDNPYAKPDPVTLKARKEGYPARSVYKLEEIDKRCKIFKGGQHVLDLGAAPGSWSLYASRKISANGRLVAVDLTEITQAFPSNVTVHQGDALVPSGAVESRAPYDVIISDMAPRTSGDRFRDQLYSYQLVVGSLQMAARYGKPGSSFIAKIFMSNEFSKAKKQVIASYDTVRVVKPQASRSNSWEVFLVGLGLKQSAHDAAQIEPIVIEEPCATSDSSSED
ncbi:MAG: RlmE family RNA methyltransferase [Polyangiaceae bacterium]|nr:RlmE family RNA methyltransferase [Polyangiaceae bacterium]